MSLTPSPCFPPSRRPGSASPSLLFSTLFLAFASPWKRPGGKPNPLRGVVVPPKYEVPRTAYQSAAPTQAHCWSNAWWTGGVLTGNRLMDGSWAAMGQAAAITDVRRIVCPAPPTRKRSTRGARRARRASRASRFGQGVNRDPWLPWQGLSGLVQGLSRLVDGFVQCRYAEDATEPHASRTVRAMLSDNRSN
ncbi:hypothetical protein EDB80DRAFT_678885 [Ilyonectria destructans]|nr:hypothetical protein EDB80DRAFT_678885 [Ilyonectria destructans]